MLLATTQVEDLGQSLVSDPEVPPSMQQAGHTSRPQAAQLISHCDA